MPKFSQRSVPGTKFCLNLASDVPREGILGQPKRVCADVKHRQILNAFGEEINKTDVIQVTKKGLGLGLTLCYSVIKKHDGHICIESEPGKGTTVILYLPAFIQPPSA